MRPGRSPCWRPPSPAFQPSARALGHIGEWSPDAAVAVPVGDSAGLAEAIAKILEDEELRLRIARAAQQRGVREDADYTAGCFQALYMKLRR
jgi:glycosyltransferase involved in cell wall biosynthesis